MPGADEIIAGLATISNAWQPLSGAWHVYVGLLAGAFLVGWRPSKRVVAALLVPPVVSVSVLAWVGGNPFNGMAFAFLSLALVLVLGCLSNTPVELAAGIWRAVGTLLFGFGWVYPHFLDADSASMYFYAAPLGLVPCPTLAIAVAVTVLFRGLGSAIWSSVLFIAGLFYGLFGSLYLGVTIDWILTAGALGLLILLVRQSVPKDVISA